MRISTYNVNGVKGRLPVLLRWLSETAPDIVCLQEIKTSDETFPFQAIEDAGYGAIWHGQKSYNASPSWRGAVNRKKPSAASPATPMTPTAAISRRRSRG